jgi:hypothetical protein
MGEFWLLRDILPSRLFSVIYTFELTGYYKRNTHFQRYMEPKPLNMWTRVMHNSIELG